MIEALQVDADDFELKTLSTGHRALFAHVVLTAIHDALGISRACGESKRTLRRRALNWINSPATCPGSLRWYCLRLDIDADALRGRINVKAGLPVDIAAATAALERAA